MSQRYLMQHKPDGKVGGGLSSAAIAAMPLVFVGLWSTGFLGAKAGLPYAEPLTFLALRMGLAVAIVVVIAFATGARWPRGAGFLHNTIAGLLIHGVYLGGVFVAMHERMPAGIAALMVGLQPVLTSTLANRLLGERVTPAQWAGLALGIVGIALVVRGRVGGEGASLLAWLAISAALLGITCGTIYQKHVGAAGDVWGALPVQYAAAFALFGLGALSFETRQVQWTAEFIAAVTWLSVVLSCGAAALLYLLIRRSAATRVASLFYLTPVVTAALSWLLFGERLDPLSVVGMVLCVLGVLLVNRAARSA